MSAAGPAEMAPQHCSWDRRGEAGTFEHAASSVELFIDRWRRAGETGIEIGDRSLGRFGPRATFVDGLKPAAYDTVIDTGVDRPALDRAGFLGCAAPFAELLATEMQPGARALVAASAGGVSHALDFVAGQGMLAATRRALVEIDAGVEGPPPEHPDETAFDPFTSQASARRETSGNLPARGRPRPRVRRDRVSTSPCRRSDRAGADAPRAFGNGADFRPGSHFSHGRTR